jgi:prepilin-type N-terminal cleavage/methylation domain-containing protein
MMAKQVEKRSIKTSPATIRTKLPRAQTAAWGFTLVELLVVVALIGLLGVFALPSVGNFFKVTLSSANRELASTIKETYNATAMVKRVHRLVFDLKENTYWVESGPEDLQVATEASREVDERKKRFRREENGNAPPPFVLETNITRSKISLPQGVEFDGIFTEYTSEEITEGTAYTHFFPHGVTEQTVIHLKDSSNHFATLVVQPLTGRVRLFERKVPSKEALLE